MGTMTVARLAQRAIDGDEIEREGLLGLVEAPLEELCDAADEIRHACCGDRFELCTIMSVKSGACPEDCRFCAQSARWGGTAPRHGFAPADEIAARARSDARRGSQRFSLVASGERVDADDIGTACEAASAIARETGIGVCASLGLLDRADFDRLRQAGVTRIHNNLETSRSHFGAICTTHSHDRKLEALRAAKDSGLEICSGGIVGMGETWGQRVELACELRALGVDSVPINVLNPIPGTPLQDREPLGIDEVRRVFAIFRFALPTAALRLAGGRVLLPDAGRSCLRSGANAAISGDMLTTAGFDIESDLAMVAKEGLSTGTLP